MAAYVPDYFKPTITPTASASATGLDAIKKYFNQPISLNTQIFLTGGVPFLPLIPFIGPIVFSLTDTLGKNGANLLVSGAPAWAAAKFGTNFSCQGAYILISNAYPGRSWLPYAKILLTYANPWTVFDMVSIWDPKFRGFRMPFIGTHLNPRLNENETVRVWNRTQAENVILGNTVDPAFPKCFTKKLEEADPGYKQIVLDLSGNPTFEQAKDDTGELMVDDTGAPVYGTTPAYVLDASGNPIKTYGRLTPVTFGAMLIYVAIWINTMSSLLPASLSAKLDSWINWLIKVLGAVLALVSAITLGSVWAVPGAASSLASALMPSSQTTPSSSGTQRGGGKKAVPKNLNEIIQNALDNTPQEMPVQAGGGGKETDESIIFLGSLAIISMAGISLALIRRKNISGVTV